MRIPARLDGGGVEGLFELASVVGHDAAALSRTCPSGKAVQLAPACSASIRSPGAEGSTIMVPSSCFSPIRRGAAPLLSNMSTRSAWSRNHCNCSNDRFRRPNTLSSGTSWRSEEHTSELQSLMRISYAVFCLKKKTERQNISQNESSNENK